MIKAVILALLATAANAQTVAAGARAVVGADPLPVYAKMSQAGDVLVTLKRGDIVTIGLVLFDADITWCAISRAGEAKRLGFASCEFLEPDRSSKAVEPPGLTPPPEPLPKPKPVIREPPPPKPPPAPNPIPQPPHFVQRVLKRPRFPPALPPSTHTPP